MPERPFAPSADVGPFSGFVGAVLGAALSGSAVVALALAVEDGFDFGALVLTVVYFVFAFMASIVVVPMVALLVGLPFGWILARLRLESAASYAAGGSFIGLLPLLTGGADAEELIVKASFGVYGGVCGLLWWRLERSTRQPLADE